MLGELLADRRGSATASAATWRCWCCPRSSSGRGGSRRRPFWPRATAVRSRRDPGLPLPGRGLLGPRVDAPAAGVRLHVRQAALRPPRARRGAAGPRALPRRPRLPGPARALPREPRRAARRRDVPARRPPGGGGPHVLRAGAPLLPPGAARGEKGPDLDAPRPRAVGACGRGDPLPSTAACSLCLKDPAFRDGIWQLLACRPAWEGNASSDDFIAFAWTGPGDRRRLVAVNYAGHRSQCFVGMPWSDLDGPHVAAAPIV